MGALMGAEKALTGALGRFFALSEAYPDLKANQNMMKLQEELAPRRTGSPSPARPSTTR
jgi:LemA protein